jgi:hypothetical protein
MKKREAWNLVYHTVAGAALAALVAWSIWFMVLATFIYAFLREQAQHRYILTPEPGLKPLVRAEKRTFFDFGWLGWRQAFEIAQWTVGAALACLAFFIVSR